MYKPTAVRSDRTYITFACNHYYSSLVIFQNNFLWNAWRKFLCEFSVRELLLFFFFCLFPQVGLIKVLVSCILYLVCVGGGGALSFPLARSLRGCMQGFAPLCFVVSKMLFTHFPLGKHVLLLLLRVKAALAC